MGEIVTTALLPVGACVASALVLWFAGEVGRAWRGSERQARQRERERQRLQQRLDTEAGLPARRPRPPGDFPEVPRDHRN